MNGSFKKSISYAASLKFSVICLLLMACIVVCGTLYQSTDGLYAARERFFQSWFILTRFYIPFPGMKLVSLALIINIFASLLLLARKPLKNSGLVLLHVGIILQLSGIMFSSSFSREFFLPVAEGETVSAAYSSEKFEIAVFRLSDSYGSAYYTSDSVAVSDLRSGHEVHFLNSGIKAGVKNISKGRHHEDDMSSPFCQVVLIPGEFCSSRSGEEIVLKSGDPPYQLNCDRETVFLSLRPMAFPLPVTLHLLDFSKKFYPGTETLKEVGSHISVRSGAEAWDVLISMNKPFRYGSYTFYQASFSHHEEKEVINLSVVYNPHRLYPYVASLFMIGGFLLHFIMIVISKKIGPEYGKSGKEIDYA